jgi:hypothetical protein
VIKEFEQPSQNQAPKAWATPAETNYDNSPPTPKQVIQQQYRTFKFFEASIGKRGFNKASNNSVYLSMNR